MKKIRWVSFFVFIATLLFTWGCAPAKEGYSIEQLQKTAEYSILETSNAQPTETIPPLPTRQISNTPNPNATHTPTLTLTPTLVPTNTLSLPSPTSPAQVIVSKDTNCRTGPSNHYDWKTLVTGGQTVVVVGESQDSYYWVIQNPNDSGTCWLWKAYTTLVAPIGRLPIFASPPTKTPTRTPTPTPSTEARFQFNQVTICNGQEVLIVSVFNYSRRILQNWRARLFTMPGKILQVTVAGNQFGHSMDTCVLTVNTLDFRQTGYMIIPFNSSVATEFYVEVEACNNEGPERDCSPSIISFNTSYITATPTYTPTPTNTQTPTPTSTSTVTPTKTP